MRIAIAASGPSLDDSVEARFGRCAYFLIVDTDTMAFEAIENPNIAVGGGAGIQSAQLMAEKGVQTILAGNCGPNAFRTFGAAGIQVIVGISGVVREAVEQFKAGAFAAASDANVASHFGTGAGASAAGMGMGGGMGQGMGGGGGMGRGMGQGRGMGRGMGMAGAPPAAPYPPPQGAPQQPGPQMSPDNELDALKEQAQAMSEQLQAINARISELGRPRTASALIAVVDSEKCDGCGACADVCPTAAIAVTEIAEVAPEKCQGCGRCVAVCPQDALSLRRA